MKRAISLIIPCAACLLTACASSIKPSGPSPLLVASCPNLAPLSDDSFGAVTAKLVEVAGMYQECRAAAGIKDLQN